MSSATSTAHLPSGLSVLTTFPDVLFIPEFDAIYQGTAALFYLSAAVLEATSTYFAQALQLIVYRENIAAVVFAFLATLMYVIHQVFSLRRWKSS
ncbi:PREDICTED: myelin and lymphocyte protein isoform X3 [Pterocles gutturalis]|uniref:myelin and lymphocyte protein isoform X3 n=1 Tax=Pterocles gutturalis TaxID=240206 RepID=UPI0005280526|nr:PREDICTED: myelin and lymphocyte protein isoform X3 [Pterocles gutturalis]